MDRTGRKDCSFVLGGLHMGTLVALGFDGIHRADEVINRLRTLHKEHLLDLEDACVVERDSDGAVHVKQAVNLTALGESNGSPSGKWLGTLVGFMFLNPVAGMALGATAGAGANAVSALLPEYGVSADFTSRLKEIIPKNSSALFILIRKASEENVLADVEPYKPRILRTQLPDDAETKLKDALSRAA